MKHRFLRFVFSGVILLLLAVSCTPLPQAQESPTPIAQGTIISESKSSETPLPITPPTVIPSIIAFTPTPTVHATVTPASCWVEQSSQQDASEMPNISSDGLFIFFNQASYNFIQNTSTGFPLTEIHSNSKSLQEAGPGNGLFLSFSNLSNRMAYWVDQEHGQLWLSDVFFENPALILDDTERNYKIEYDPFIANEIMLTWSPDDSYLILDVQDENFQDLLIHTATGEIQDWNYQCDQIGLSPKSGKMVTWCSSTTLPTHYAMMEWGGEIWCNFDEPPANLMRAETGKPSVWSWSADGEQIAYFDPNDATGSLVITDSSGNSILALPEKVYWLAEKHFPLRLLSKVIRWSQQGNRILFYGKGNDTHPCPLWMDIYAGDNTAYQSPCWQVADMISGEVIWSLGDSANQIAKPYDPEIIQAWNFHDAEISTDGSFVILSSRSGGLRHLHLIELDSGNVVQWWDFAGDAMRWVSQSP